MCTRVSCAWPVWCNTEHCILLPYLLQESRHCLVQTSCSQAILFLRWVRSFLLSRKMCIFLLTLHPLHLSHFHTIFATTRFRIDDSMLVQKTPHCLVWTTVLIRGVMSTWMMHMVVVYIPMSPLDLNTWNSIRLVERKIMILHQIKCPNSMFPKLIRLFNPFDFLKCQWNSGLFLVLCPTWWDVSYEKIPTKTEAWKD